MTDRPLTVLITDPHLRGGGQVRYVTNLAAQLVELGHRPVIGCRPGSILVESAREAGCPAYDQFNFRGGLRPGAWRRDFRALKAFVRDEKPDILHVNGSQDHWLAAVGNRLLGQPATVLRTRHNTFTVSGSIPNRWLNRDWTDFQIVVCETVRQDLAAQPAFPADRMCAIHNGVDAERFDRDPAAYVRLRKEFGFSDDHVVLGIVARLVQAKGHEFLFRALAQVKNDYPGLRLLVLGEGPLREELEALAAELGIGSVTVFAGFRDDMPACVQAIDIGVQPSIDCDTSSFSLKEIMAAGKPVIASDYGGLIEIVNDGVEGYIVATGTVDPLAGALRKFMVNPESRAIMGEAARQRVRRDFTVQVFAEKTVAAYRRALSQREAVPA